MQYIIGIKTFIMKLRPFNSRVVPPVSVLVFVHRLLYVLRRLLCLVC